MKNFTFNQLNKSLEIGKFVLNNDLENLLNYLRISKYSFQEEWTYNSQFTKKLLSYPLISYEWILLFYLPLLSYIKVFNETSSSPLIIGISGLPGCGKSTSGKILRMMAADIKIPISVISMDDFYLPSYRLEKAIKGNPWNVPRGIPGSHSIREMEESLTRYLDTGFLKAPQFDKSLRDGLGDRSGKITSKPKVLILEGWFLGCLPLNKSERKNIYFEPDLQKPLTNEEVDYRSKIQERLYPYLSIWKKLSSIWHLKADKFVCTSNWKRQQENNQHKFHGSSLKDEKLESFIRMISTSIPQISLQNIDADITMTINNDRQIKGIYIN